MSDDHQSRTRPYDRALSPEERAAEQRTRILDAATELYAEHGVYATRTEDIVAHARVSRRTLYEHFRDLEQLRFAVFERAVASTLLEFGRIVQDPTPADRLQTALQALFQKIVDSPKFARIVMAEFRLPEPRNQELRAQIVQFFLLVLIEGMAQDHREGRTPELPDELTLLAILGAFEGLIMHMLETDERAAQALDAVPVALKVFRRVYPWRPRDGSEHQPIG